MFSGNRNLPFFFSYYPNSESYHGDYTETEAKNNKKTADNNIGVPFRSSQYDWHISASSVFIINNDKI